MRSSRQLIRTVWTGTLTVKSAVAAGQFQSRIQPALADCLVTGAKVSPVHSPPYD